MGREDIPIERVNAGGSESFCDVLWCQGLWESVGNELRDSVN